MKLSELYAPLAPVERAIQSKMVHCDGCVHCCNTTGLIWVLPSEVEPMRAVGANLGVSEHGELFYVSRQTPNCPMLDLEKRQCTIYQERPLCCRLFPLDMRFQPGRLPRWVLFHTCPENRMKSLNKLKVLVGAIETLLPQSTFSEMAFASGQMDALNIADLEATDYATVRFVKAQRIPRRFPVNIR